MEPKEALLQVATARHGNFTITVPIFHRLFWYQAANAALEPYHRSSARCCTLRQALSQRCPSELTWLLSSRRAFRKSDHSFHLDVWLFGIPLLIVTSPSMSIQACQQYDLPQPATLKPSFYPFAGRDNLFVIIYSSPWCRVEARSLSNPGFNANYLLGQMNHIIE